MCHVVKDFQGYALGTDGALTTAHYQLCSRPANTITAANLGDLVYSTIQITNNGPATATGVLVNDPTPAGLTYANNYYTGIGTFNPTTGWNIGTLENGATAILNIAYYVTGTGTITNTATATTTTTDPNNNNNANRSPAAKFMMRSQTCTMSSCR